MKVVVIGFGKLGTCIAHILQQSNGIQLVQVYNRSIKTTNPLGLASDVFTNQLAHIITDADVYFITVTDNAIAEVAAQMPRVAGLVVHMSGATPMEVLMPVSSSVGVLWPMKSIGIATRQIAPNTICYQGNTEETTRRIAQLAHLFTPQTLLTTQLQRQQYHMLAAVTSNFTNHLYALAQEYCQQHQLPFATLQSLIEETATRLATTDAKTSQTGPALRGDEKTIATHRQLLQQNAVLLNLYNACTSSIQLFHNR
jgi:predicted short-subunit dehydrogenase-like oxidoreductase (DUF2520 family)